MNGSILQIFPKFEPKLKLGNQKQTNKQQTNKQKQQQQQQYM